MLIWLVNEFNKYLSQTLIKAIAVLKVKLSIIITNTR